jgi:hypothetical protein
VGRAIARPIEIRIHTILPYSRKALCGTQQAELKFTPAPCATGRRLSPPPPLKFATFSKCQPAFSMLSEMPAATALAALVRASTGPALPEKT